MLFNSITFFLFLIFALLCFWFLSKTYRVGFLVICSVVFYGFWSFPFYSLLIVSTVVDFTSAKLINASEKPINRRVFLTISIFTNLGLLVYFKYYNFFIMQINNILHFDIQYLEIILPIGISFYTFQSMSYSIDVYRGKIKPETSFLQFLNYVTFFPQLVAGPIVRFGYFREQIAQICKRPQPNYYEGFRLIIYGLFLKICLADNLAPMIDEGFLISPAVFGSLDVLTLAYAFGFQIYFDFCGYSLIAIGAARLFGVNLPSNFEFPYLSKNIREFWKRWHISLSSWIRDYLYEPLKSAFPASFFGSAFALLISWSVMGFWHGASWTFVMWGVWNGLAILLYRTTQMFMPKFKSPIFRRILDFLGWVFTLNIIMMGWIWFRAESIQAALELFTSLTINQGLFYILNPNLYITCFVILTCIFFSKHIWSTLFVNDKKNKKMMLPIFDSIALISVLAFLTEKTQFIYFQF